MPRILLIDAAARTVTEAVVTDTYPAIKSHIGGWICVAGSLESGDTVFVDDEGLMKPYEHFFKIPANAQPLAGNGVVTGPDGYDDKGEEITLDVTMTPEQMTAQITWLTRDEFVAWAKQRGNEAAISVTTIKGGVATTEVLATYDDMVAMGEPSSPEIMSGTLSQP